MENYFIIEDGTYVGVKFKEYKELLEIKGKYEELKQQQPLIFYDGLKQDKTFKPPYTITCE